jgi:hypothetical protein
MTADEKRVADLIRAAFRDVHLGNGVGLRQGQALDDYADAATEAKYRAEDEKDDWSRVSTDDLNTCYSSLSFFDAEGMRFHLPAFLIADLEGTYKMDVIFHLTHFAHGMASRFALFTEPQRHAVREFLLLRLSNAGIDEIGFIGPQIEKALAEYWVE